MMKKILLYLSKIANVVLWKFSSPALGVSISSTRHASEPKFIIDIHPKNDVLFDITSNGQNISNIKPKTEENSNEEKLDHQNVQ